MYGQYLTEAIDILICDEGHRLKNPATKQYSVLDRLRTYRRILITGTPIQNNLMELYACIRFLNPSLFRSDKHFKAVYADPISRGLHKHSQKAEVEMSRIRSKDLMDILTTFFIRRTQKILENFLPKRHEFIVYLNPTPYQLELYNRVLEAHKNKNIDAGLSPYNDMFSMLCSLRQVLLHPSTFLTSIPRDLKLTLPSPPSSLESIVPSPTLLQAIENTTVQSPGNSLHPAQIALMSPKLHFLLHLLGQLLPGDNRDPEKIVVVSYFTSVLDEVQALLDTLNLDWARLDGSMSAKDRDKHLKKFCLDMNCNVFLLAAKAGGTGLNIVQANRMILLDVDWNPSNDAQVMGRVYRKGQKREVYIYRVVIAGTVEEKIMERQISKLDLSSLVADGTGNIQANFSLEELKALFSMSSGKVGRFVEKRRNYKAEIVKRVNDCKGADEIIQWILIDEEKGLQIGEEIIDSDEEMETSAPKQDPDTSNPVPIEPEQPLPTSLPQSPPSPPLSPPLSPPSPPSPPTLSTLFPPLPPLKSRGNSDTLSKRSLGQSSLDQALETARNLLS